MLTDFNDFRHTSSWRNLTLADCKFAHLTWEHVTQYLAKNKVVHKFETMLFSSKKVGGSEKNWLCCVQNKWQQCYRECSNWPPFAWTHAPSHFRHWSVASTTTLCCSPAHVLTSHCWKMTFLIFPRYSSYSMWANLQSFNVKYLQDSVYQKWLKSVHFWRSYSKNKNVIVFFGHSILCSLHYNSDVIISLYAQYIFTFKCLGLHYTVQHHATMLIWFGC